MILSFRVSGLKKARWYIMSLLFLILSVAIYPFIGANERSHLRNINMLVEINSHIYLLDGLGHQQRILESSEYVKYSSPIISRASRYIVNRYIFDTKQPHKMPVIQMLLKDYQQSTEWLFPENVAEGSDHSWSPNLQKIAYIDGDNLVVFEIENRKEIYRNNDLDLLEIGNDKIAWKSDNELMIFQTSSDTDSIYLFDLNRNTIRKLCSSKISSAFYEGVLWPQNRGKNLDCSDIPEWELLFGSREWPVLLPIPTNNPLNKRFYFYYRWKDSGFFYPGKKWIEGYDRVRQKTFFVATVESVWDRLMR